MFKNLWLTTTSKIEKKTRCHPSRAVIILHVQRFNLLPRERTALPNLCFLPKKEHLREVFLQLGSCRSHQNERFRLFHQSCLWATDFPTVQMSHCECRWGVFIAEFSLVFFDARFIFLVKRSQLCGTIINLGCRSVVPHQKNQSKQCR